MVWLMLSKSVKHLLSACDYSLSAGPLMTAIQELPTSDEIKEIASLDIFDLTPYILPDMLYRFHRGMNYFIYIHGYRAFFKSTFAIWWAYQCSLIGGFELPPQQSDFIVDSNMALVNLIREDKPKFFTAIKDEVDKQRHGAVTQTIETVLTNQINRIRGRQYNIIYCTPEDYYFPIDFKFKTWRFRRKPTKKACINLLVEHEGLFVGHVKIPMPPEFLLNKYHRGIKKGFLARTQTLTDDVQDEHLKIIDELLEDPDFEPRERKGRFSNIFSRKRYIAKKYPFLTEGLKKEIEREVARLEALNE